MNQSFGQVFSIAAASILFFIFPVYLFSQQQDILLQSYVWEETAEFAEMVKNNGYISKNMYDRYLKNLQMTNQIYEIKMTHKHKIIQPVYNDEGYFMDEVQTTYENHYEKEILSVIYEQKSDYLFRQEDYFSVTIKNKSHTLAEKMRSLLFGRTSEHSILITYGGLIRDENV